MSVANRIVRVTCVRKAISRYKHHDRCGSFVTGIYLIYAYAKNEQEDLTPAQVKTLAALMKDIKHG